MSTVAPTPTVAPKAPRRTRKTETNAVPNTDIIASNDVKVFYVGVAAKKGDPAFAAYWADGKYVRLHVTSKKRSDFTYQPRIVGSSVERVIAKMATAFPDATYQQNADAETDAATQYAARIAAKKEGKS